MTLDNSAVPFSGFLSVHLYLCWLNLTSNSSVNWRSFLNYQSEMHEIVVKMYHLKTPLPLFLETAAEIQRVLNQLGTPQDTHELQQQL